MEKINENCANYLTVLDFETGKVIQYKINQDWNPDEEACEDFMFEQGHYVSNCQWMVHSCGDLYYGKNFNKNKYDKYDKY